MNGVPAAHFSARFRSTAARLFSSPHRLIRALVLLPFVTGAVTMLAQAPPKEAEQATKARLASRSLLLDAARAGNSVVVVGERGHILTSSDSGATWKQADVPTRSALTGVHFHDAKLGWAVGHDAVILRTRDGGTNWERVHWAPEDDTPFLDVWFADASRGIAIGAYGHAMITTDGGTTWNEQPVSEGDDFHLNQITRAPNGHLYIAAESGNAYRSDDGGESWSRIETPYDGSFFGVLPLENESLLIFGLRGHLYRSDDGGANWAQIDTGTTAMINSGLRLSDGTVVLVGLGGTVLVSRDGGRSFELRQQSTRSGIQTVIDAGNGTLILVGEAGARQLRSAELVK